MEKRFKKINRTGGVTIPADIRRDLGINETSGFDISVNAEGDIILQKHFPTCIFCGEHATIKHLSKDLCIECVKSITKEAFI